MLGYRAIVHVRVLGCRAFLHFRVLGCRAIVQFQVSCNLTILLGGDTWQVRDTVKAAYYNISVPYTTRPMREGEVAGRDYNFVSIEEFKKMIEDDVLLEHGMHNKHLYGTMRLDKDQVRESGVIDELIHLYANCALATKSFIAMRIVAYRHVFTCDVTHEYESCLMSFGCLLKCVWYECVRCGYVCLSVKLVLCVRVRERVLVRMHIYMRVRVRRCASMRVHV